MIPKCLSVLQLFYLLHSKNKTSQYRYNLMYWAPILKNKLPHTVPPFLELIKIKPVKYNYTPQSSIFGQIYSAFVFTNLNNERHSWHLFWQEKYSITVWQSIVFWSLMLDGWSAVWGVAHSESRREYTWQIWLIGFDQTVFCGVTPVR